MEVIYSEATKQRPENHALLQSYTALLTGNIGPSSSSSRVKAEWDQKQDELGTITYSMRISDATGDVTASFRPDELARPLHMRFRLLRLWGELLQARIDRHLGNLTSDEA